MPKSKKAYIECCKMTSKSKKHKCIRKKDGKLFTIKNRRFSKSQCSNPKGFSMKASCAPYKYCKKTMKGGKNNKTNKNRRNKNKTNKKHTKSNNKTKHNKMNKKPLVAEFNTYEELKKTIQNFESAYKSGDIEIKQLKLIMVFIIIKLKSLETNKEFKQMHELALKYAKFIITRTKKKNEKAMKKMTFDDM